MCVRKRRGWGHRLRIRKYGGTKGGIDVWIAGNKICRWRYRERSTAGRARAEGAVVDCVWNVMAHAQKPNFVFQRNGRIHLNRRGLHFSLLLAGELCTSAYMVSTARASLCSAVMWRLLVTHYILLFPLHFPSRASPCAITFQLDSTRGEGREIIIIRRSVFTVCHMMWRHDNVLQRVTK
jgi:hypothetical protein